MTKVEARYEFAAPFSDSWLSAIESLHGVYGMEAVKLHSNLDGLTILFDASRLKLTDVENYLQRAGLPVRRSVEASA